MRKRHLFQRNYGLFVFICVWLSWGCEKPVELEKNPLDPGVDEFVFSPADVRASGTSSSRLILTWRNRSMYANQFPLERSTDEEPFVSLGYLIGSEWHDLAVSPGHTYCYRLRARSGSVVSLPTSVMAWWRSEIMFRNGEVILPWPDKVLGMAMSRQSFAVFVWQSGGRLTVVNTNGSIFQVAASVQHPGSINGVAIGRSTPILAVASDSLLTIYNSSLVIQWSRPMHVGLFSPSIDENSGLVLTGGSDGKIRVWNAQTQTVIDSLSVGEGSVISCSYSGDGGLISTLSANGTVRNFRAVDHALLNEVIVAGGTHLMVDPSGTYVAVRRAGTNDVRVIRTSDGGVVTDVSGIPNIQGMAFASTGSELLLAGDAPGIMRWDIPRARTIPPPSDLTGSYSAVAGGGFGLQYALARPGGTVALWHAEPQWTSVQITD